MTCVGFLSLDPHSWSSSPMADGWNLHLVSQDHALLPAATASPLRWTEVPLSPGPGHTKLQAHIIERALPPAWLVPTTWCDPLPFGHTLLLSRWRSRKDTWLLKAFQRLYHLPEIFDTTILGALFKFSVSQILRKTGTRIFVLPEALVVLSI